MNSSFRARHLVFVLVGVAGLLLKSWLQDSLPEFAISYLGNLSASFAVYFVVRLADPDRFSPLVCALAALAVVELFEASNGFGVMSNVYDPLDYAANALGVGLGVGVEVVSSRLLGATRVHKLDSKAEARRGRNAEE
jgi:hypothetical protein